MNRTAYLLEPMACSERERREFARLVRRGFPLADESLDGRIRAARWLAFHYAGDTLAGIAALKAPGEAYRQEVFEKADARVSAEAYEVELGWVYVVPDRRGSGIARGLCQLLLARAATSRVYATTRTDNGFMMRVLRAVGFARVGKSFPRRGEELVLFLRPGGD